MRPDRLELGGEDPVGAELGLDRHGGRDVRRTHQDGEVGQRHHQHAEHPVGAVDQRQPLLGGELDRRQSGRRERLRGGHQGPRRVAHLALADQRQRAVRERCEVAGAAERAVLVHHRRDAGVEHAGDQLRHLRSYAGPAGRQRREPQQHQPADDLALDLRTRARQRASGPATAAAGRASRSGCAGSRGRRTRWRSRRPAWEPRPAPRRPRAPARWRPGRRRSARPAHPHGRRRRPPRRTGHRRPPGRCRGQARNRWSGYADSCDDSTSSGGPLPAPTATGPSRIPDIDPGGTMRTAGAALLLLAVLLGTGLRGTARAGVQEGRQRGDPDREGLADNPTPRRADPVAPPRAPRRCRRPPSRCRSCPKPQGPRPGPRRRRQLAAVPQGDGHPAEAGAGLADAGRRRSLRDPRADQRARLLPEPLPGQPGRVGAEPPPDGRGLLGDQHPRAAPPRGVQGQGTVRRQHPPRCAEQRRLPAGDVQPGHHEAGRAAVPGHLARRRAGARVRLALGHRRPTPPWCVGPPAATPTPASASGPTPPRPCGSTWSATCDSGSRSGAPPGRPRAPRRCAVAASTGCSRAATRVLGQWVEAGRDMNVTCPGTSAQMLRWFHQY